DFIGGKFGAIGTARAAGAKLVAWLDLIERSRLRVVKFHRVRRIPAQYGVLREVDGYCLLFARRRQRNVDGIAPRIDVVDQPSEAVPLPFLPLAGMFVRDVHLLHGDDRRGSHGSTVISKSAAHKNAIARLKVPQLDGS